MFDYLNFINLEKPSNLTAFLGLFETNILNITPNFFSNKELDEEETPQQKSSSTRRILVEEVDSFTTMKCSVHRLIRENESSCYFLNSVGDLFLYFIAYLLMKIAVIALIRLCFRSLLYRVQRDEEKKQLKLEQEKQHV